MSAILDRLDADPGGARRYVAHLIVVGGATHARIAAALASKYGVAEPTTRSVGKWRNNDAELIELVRELEAIKRDAAPDADLTDALPPPVNRAQVAADFMEMTEQFPAFGDLMQRAVEAEAAKPATTAWGVPLGDSDDAEEAADDSGWADVHAALAASADLSDEEFDAECRRRLDGWEPPPPAPTHGAGALAD